MRLPGDVAVLLSVPLWSGPPSQLLRWAGDPPFASGPGSHRFHFALRDRNVRLLTDRDRNATQRLNAMLRPTPRTP
jgi:hypothetical protein